MARRHKKVIWTKQGYSTLDEAVGPIAQDSLTAAQHLLGYTEAEAVGKPLSMIFTAEDHAAGITAAEIEKAARRVRVEKAKVGFAKEALAICNLPVLNFLTLRRR